jgi:hypothetical protein
VSKNRIGTNVEKLVEQVARAMCADLGVHADDWSEEEGVRTYAWQKEASTARSAILATLRGVREADDALVNAAVQMMGDEGGYDEVFTFTIDHLIKTVEG